MAYHAHAFIDGAYLRSLTKQLHKDLADPRILANFVLTDREIQWWGARQPHEPPQIVLTRVTYYDARPDTLDEAHLKDYWKAVELLPDTQLGLAGSAEGPNGKKLLIL